MACVYVTKRVNVYPKTMQPPKYLKLSNLDRQCPTLMYLVFFYKPSNDHIISGKISANDYVFSTLKSSLEETLSLWYPATGRLSRNPTDGKLDLWCNNEGAIMVEAVTQARISDLGNLSLYNDFYEKLVYKPVFNGNLSEMPLLVAQVTKFGCGGYSIGVGTSHSLFDGQATFNFLSVWASKTHANNKQSNYQCHQPVHDRERLFCISSPSNNNHQMSAMALAKVAAIQHLYQLITQTASSGGVANGGGGGSLKNNPHKFVPCISEDCVMHTFNLSGSMIDNLKRKIFGLGNSSSSCSSFEIVAAHLWKARTKALGLRRDRKVCLQFSVDTRTRLVPQLSQGFSGNAYVLASVALSAGELEAATYETLINMIKAAKNSINNEYVSTYLMALEGCGAALPPLRELTMVSDWTRTPYHKMNFMHNRAPFAGVCPLVPPVPQVAYFMQSPKEDKGIDVRIGLSPQILSVFSHYFLKTT